MAYGRHSAGRIEQYGVLLPLLVLLFKSGSGQTWGESITIDVNETHTIEYIRYPNPVTWDEARIKCGQAAPSTHKTHLLCFESRLQISSLMSQNELNGFQIWLSNKNCSSGKVERFLSLHVSGSNGSWHFGKESQHRLGFICRKFVKKAQSITEGIGEIESRIQVCPAMTRRNITWPQTPGNSHVSLKCPDRMKGFATWFCNGTTGEWTPKRPNMSKCRSVALTNVLLRSQSQQGDVLNLQETAEQLRQMMKGLQTGGDLQTTVTILDKVEDIFVSQAPAMTPAQRKKMALGTSEHVINVCDQLLTKSEAWDDLTPEQRHNTATTFLTAVDETGNILATSIEKQKHEIATTNVVLEVVKAGQTAGERRNETFADQSQNSLSLVLGPETQHVVFAFYADLRTILPLHQDTKGSQRKTVNTAVISANISGGSLKGKARIRLVHFNQSFENSTCVYWDIKSQQWNSTGCSVVESSREYTVCECEHLTNFAVLMDMSGASEQLSLVDKVTLAVITVIGCSISIICLSICVVIFTFYRSLWGMRVMLHRNLCISLLLAQTILLGGLERTENKVVCACIAGLLQYFFLCAFFWMFLEAFHILWLLIKVFNPKDNHAIKFYIVGYGCPALIVAISAAVKHRGYGTPHFCWLNVNDGTIWTFIGPVLLIIMFNTVSLAYALYTTHRILKSKDKGRKTGLKTWVRGTAVLMPLLGVTWVLGFLYIEKKFIAFAYVFAVLNSLQGLGIFLFHCILNKKVNEHVRLSLTRSSVFKTSEVSTRISKTPPGRSSSSPKRRTSKFLVSTENSESQRADDSSRKADNSLDSEQSAPFLPQNGNSVNTAELYPMEVEKG